jgi:hypothetical protein
MDFNAFLDNFEIGFSILFAPSGESLAKPAQGWEIRYELGVPSDIFENRLRDISEGIFGDLDWGSKQND